MLPATRIDRTVWRGLSILSTRLFDWTERDKRSEINVGGMSLLIPKALRKSWFAISREFFPRCSRENSS